MVTLELLKDLPELKSSTSRRLWLRLFELIENFSRSCLKSVWKRMKDPSLSPQELKSLELDSQTMEDLQLASRRMKDLITRL